MSAQYERMTRNFRFSIPLFLAVPAAFWLAFSAHGQPMAWSAFGIGALGWLIALQLRAPIGLFAKRLPPARAMTLVVSSSGPLEEGVRLSCLLLTARSLDWAASLGQGWAAIEVVFAIVQGIAMSRLLLKDDAKSAQLKALIEAQGSVNLGPLWGVAERIFASALHIGSALLLARSPWLVLVLIPIHSGVNLAAVRLAKRSVRGSVAFTAAMGTVVLAAGLAVFA